MSGSRQFILDVARCLKNAGIHPKEARKRRSSRQIAEPDTISVYEVHRGGKLVAYELKLSERNSILLGRYLYERVPESMYLTRKYDAYRLAEARKVGDLTDHALASK